MGQSILSPARRQAMLDRARAKSCEQVGVNNLPRVVRRNQRETVWAVASRTEGGVIYLVHEVGGELCCDCPADHSCWHLQHVSRALSGEIGHTEAKPPRLDITSLLDIRLTPPRWSS